MPETPTGEPRAPRGGRALTFLVGASAVASVVGVLALVAGACDTTIHEGISPLCMEATAHSDYAWLETNVFQRSCGFSESCHKGNAAQEHLNLTAGRAYDSLVGMTSHERPDWLLVDPGHPEHSYLMVKLGVVESPLDGGRLMPIGGPLCQEKLDAVQRWIANGAGEFVDGGIVDAGPIDASLPDAAPADGGLVDAGSGRG